MNKLSQSQSKKSITAKKETNYFLSIKNKITTKTSHWNYRVLAKYFVVFGVVIVLVTSYFWYTRLYMTPERRFWSALNNSMATPSVVRTLSQGNEGNKVVQDFRFYYGEEKILQNNISYNETNAASSTNVETEGIVYFPQDQYLRYNAFSNSQNGKKSADIDDLLGVWALQKNNDPERSRLDYVSELISLAIFGNFDAKYRNETINQMKEQNVYGEVNNGVSKDVDGEAVVVYETSVKLKPYVTLLNNAFVRAGYGNFTALNPDDYQNEPSLPVTVTVRKKDNTIRSIDYSGRVEQYSNYGVKNLIERPDATLSVEALQRRVQEAFTAE